MLGDRGVPASDDVSRALSGGQAKAILAQAPDAARGALDGALRAAAVSGVQFAFLVSGVVAIVAGFAVLVLVRPEREAGRHEPEVLGVKAITPEELEPA